MEKKQKKKRTDSEMFVPNPIIQTILTGTLFLEIAATVYVFWGDEYAGKGIIALIGVIVAIWSVKKGFFIGGRYLSSTLLAKAPFNHPLKKKKSMRKFVAQSWQFVIHLAMGIYEIITLSNEEWLYKPHNCMEIDATGPSIRWIYKERTPVLGWFMVIQLSIWVWTCVSHRFLEEFHKDYYVMYCHHLVAIGLILFCYSWGFDRMAIVLLYLHDVSDVFIDLLKMSNYLKLEDKGGFFLTEIFYTSSIISWIYFRLYLFPVYMIYYGGFPTNFPNWPTTDGKPGLAGNLYAPDIIPKLTATDIAERDFQFYFVGPICNSLFIMLFCMHIFWFYLLGRIGWKIAIGESANEAAEEYYEGSSGSDVDENSLKTD